MAGLDVVGEEKCAVFAQFVVVAYPVARHPFGGHVLRFEDGIHRFQNGGQWIVHGDVSRFVAHFDVELHHHAVADAGVGKFTERSVVGDFPIDAANRITAILLRLRNQLRTGFHSHFREKAGLARIGQTQRRLRIFRGNRERAAGHLRLFAECEIRLLHAPGERAGKGAMR